MEKTRFEPKKEEVIEALKRIYELAAEHAIRFGSQEPNKPLIITLDYLKYQFDIKDEDLK